MPHPHIDDVGLFPRSVPTFCSNHGCNESGEYWTVCPEGKAISKACERHGREFLLAIEKLPDEPKWTLEPVFGDHAESVMAPREPRKNPNV